VTYRRERGLSFVAGATGRIAGHVAFTRSRLDAPAALVDVLVLSPLSVVPEQQRRGIGSGLVRYALGELPAAGEAQLSGTLVYHRAFWDHDAVGLRDAAG